MWLTTGTALSSELSSMAWIASESSELLELDMLSELDMVDAWLVMLLGLFMSISGGGGGVILRCSRSRSLA